MCAGEIHHLTTDKRKIGRCLDGEGKFAKDPSPAKRNVMLEKVENKTNSKTQRVIRIKSQVEQTKNDRKHILMLESWCKLQVLQTIKQVTRNCGLG